MDPSNPIYNFLLSYYGLKGAKGIRRLCRYSPGPNIKFDPSILATSNVSYSRRWLNLSSGPSLSYYDSALLPPSKSSALSWNLHLLRSTRSNPPVLNCHGMHEWAMLYRRGPGDAGKGDYQTGMKLRVDQDVLDRTVEERGIRCTHIAIEARLLDVAASPYDAREYTGGLAVEVENEEGRREYKRRQIDIMGKSRGARDRLIKAYEDALLL
ncbi:hypothetical protein TrRE_jg3114 [Triparma retinervis]|uniref:Uncharacterized protein n=1 Tax=Triparma retinervis TaxID=2557542 RepID=A0A9W7APV0_9STRA|nr:hypothetical protein TrRE_jg3114 [Triparma retinervis]